MTRQLKDRSIKLDWEHETMIGDTDTERAVAITKSPLGKLTNPTSKLKYELQYQLVS